MFERFTDRARRVVVLAQEEARRLSHDSIGTEHLLLGLVVEGDGVAAKALQQLGFDLDVLRAAVEAATPTGSAAPRNHIPFTARAKRVLEESLREALTLGHNYIGTEHILLGIVREGSGAASQILARQGASPDVVRQAVVGLLSGYQGGLRTASQGVQRSRRQVALGGDVVGDAAHRSTEGVRLVLALARALSGTEPMGTPHLLMALVSLPGVTAAKAALEQMGLDVDTLGAIEWEIEGTLDEDPADRAVRQVEVTTKGAEIEVRIADDELRARLLDALREGRISATDLAKRFGQAALDASEDAASPAPPPDD